MLIIVGLGIYYAINMEEDGEGITDIASALKKLSIDTEGLVVKENGQDAVLTDDVRDNCVIQVYPAALQEKGGVSGHHDPDPNAAQTIGLGIRGVDLPMLLRQSCTIPFQKILVERFTAQFDATAEERTDPHKAIAILTRMAGEIDGDSRIPSLVLAAPRDITMCWLSLPECTLSIEDMETGESHPEPALGEAQAAPQPVAAGASA